MAGGQGEASLAPLPETCLPEDTPWRLKKPEGPEWSLDRARRLSEVQAWSPAAGRSQEETWFQHHRQSWGSPSDLSGSKKSQNSIQAPTLRTFSSASLYFWLLFGATAMEAALGNEFSSWHAFLSCLALVTPFQGKARRHQPAF